jgi:hypothetical protein
MSLLLRESVSVLVHAGWLMRWIIDVEEVNDEMSDGVCGLERIPRLRFRHGGMYWKRSADEL